MSTRQTNALAILTLSSLWVFPSFADETESVVAQVQAVPAQMKESFRSFSAYGRLVPSANGSVQLTAPFGCRVVEVFAANDQTVKKGEPLFKLAPDPETRTLLESSRQTLAAARQNLDETNARFALKLVDRQEVLHAEQAATEAQLQMDRLTALGLGGDGTVTAPGAGIIQQVSVNVGDHVASGETLNTMDQPNRRELIVGVEPAQAAQLKIGQSLSARSVLRSTANPFSGRILRIGHTIDPVSGLVPVAAELDRADALLTQEYMDVQFLVESRNALVLPESAVLPEEGKQLVYTVQNGRAVCHAVQIETLGDGWVRMTDGDLKAGDQIVSLGNYELEDGMLVAVEVAR